MIRYHKTTNKISPKKNEMSTLNRGEFFYAVFLHPQKEKTTREGCINEDANLRGGSRPLLLRPDPEKSIFDLA
jgi:hypothetical protein